MKNVEETIYHHIFCIDCEIFNIFPFNFKMLTERNEVYNEKT